MQEVGDGGDVRANVFCEYGSFVSDIFASVVKHADDEFGVVNPKPGKKDLVVQEIKDLRGMGGVGSREASNRYWGELGQSSYVVPVVFAACDSAVLLGKG